MHKSSYRMHDFRLVCFLFKCLGWGNLIHGLMHCWHQPKYKACICYQVFMALPIWNVLNYTEILLNENSITRIYTSSRMYTSHRIASGTLMLCLCSYIMWIIRCAQSFVFVVTIISSLSFYLLIHFNIVSLAVRLRHDCSDAVRVAVKDTDIYQCESFFSQCETEHYPSPFCDIQIVL